MAMRRLGRRNVAALQRNQHPEAPTTVGAAPPLPATLLRHKCENAWLFRKSLDQHCNIEEMHDTKHVLLAPPYDSLISSANAKLHPKHVCRACQT